MAGENDYSGANHVVLPVMHADSGEIHNIAVPEDTSLEDLHSALTDGGYHPAIESKQPVPKLEDALEYSEKFKKAAGDAWQLTNAGKARKEAGFPVDRQGNPGKVDVTEDELATASKEGGGRMHQAYDPNNTMALLHVHNNALIKDPDPRDVAAAKKSGKTIYVVSRAGLFGVEPDGKVSHVFQNPDWFSSKKPK